MRDLLAEHEFRVAHFYLKRKAWKAAKGRYDTLLSAFPDYRQMDQTLYEAGVTERRLGHDEDARILWQKLAQDFPKSIWIRKLPPAARAAPAAPAAEVPAPASSAEPRGAAASAPVGR
jgi:outer membrane protein assembly factor BamD (BamD/ComL family)